MSEMSTKKLSADEFAAQMENRMENHAAFGDVK